MKILSMFLSCRFRSKACSIFALGTRPRISGSFAPARESRGLLSTHAWRGPAPGGKRLRGRRRSSTDQATVVRLRPGACFRGSRDHPFGIDEHGLDQVAVLFRQVVGERSRVGNNYALGDECEMSRSCQRATFSNPACAFDRTHARQSEICSQVTERLRGMADEPFCFSLKNSSASRTSCRCKCRISGGDLVERGSDPCVAKP